jgi:hypothetical protein
VKKYDGKENWTQVQNCGYMKPEFMETAVWNLWAGT